MIGLIDYGLGNLRAFANIYKKLNLPLVIARKPDDLIGVDRVILPGVGAFDHAIQRFNSSGMRQRIEDLVLSGQLPLLGVCVGMQMLAESSEEGSEKGLGWIPGVVKQLPTETIPYRTKLPHMGWNDVVRKNNCDLIDSIPIVSQFYFLHSYYFQCNNEADIAATTEYGLVFPSIIRRGSVYGIQCHPEKSHGYGISILESFARITICSAPE